jgi:PAS domain S-box-containing protein
MMLFAAMMTALLFRRFERERVSGDLKAARERAHGEARFRSLVQSSSDIITIIDEEGVIQYLSPSIEHVLAYSPEGMVGRSLGSLLHPDDAERVFVDLQRLAQGQEGMEIAFDCRWAHKDGSWRHVESISRNRLQEPHIGGVVLNSRDITERKQAEEALRDSERRYRNLIDAATDVVLTVSRDGRFTSLNRAFDAITGSSGTDWIGRNFGELIHPEDSAITARMLEEVFSGESPTACTVRFRLLEDDFVTVELAAAPRVEGETVTGALVIARDVTEQRRLQDQLRQAQKMEAVGQLAGGIAHDFNNLLAVIQNCAAFIMEDLDDSDQSRSDAEEISKAAERAAVLTKQLLAFSRRDIVRPEVLDLAEFVTGMEKMLRRMVMEDVGLRVKRSSTSGRAKIDPGQLEQVILNLVVNATDAMPNGGTLTIETGEAEIDETFSRQHQGLTPGEYVRLSVTDTGHGMSDDVAARVFEPFYTTKPRGSGTGLGLATVYGIVKAAGGYISVYSEVDLGTTVHVYLPTTEMAATDLLTSESTRSQSGHGERILVVEDEPGLRKLVRRILTQNGYDVLVAASGPEAVDLVRGLSGDLALLLTDVVMPGMSGGELAEILCRARPDLKAIYMSGYPDETVVLHGVLRKGQGYLQKPFSAGDLLRSVREVLDGAPVG